MKYRIAIIEDDAALRENYADALRAQGYQVISFGNRRDAETQFGSRLPDLAVIDIGLGSDVDGGFALCQWLRARSRTLPIIFLSARDSDYDIVSGLRMGADDYLTKDISLPHLMARVAALFRRIEALASTDDNKSVIEEGELSMDAQRLVCQWQGKDVGLTLTEFWMVHALVQRVGHVKNRDQLMNESRLVVDDGTITSHIKRIRRKFRAIDPEFSHIDTVYGMGYRWNPAQ
ncbi:MAG: proteobacterial dedicated sortase system response regulator [Proteobacteria bacterium]|nr:proteobacterial dedicated sortase system response regulator [Pseudomonadota bacterium]MDA1302069.1 proteobacterial dedicated sortase system response regulator [Pseudomonadota bacterium]